jgi:hypothetical protein
MVQGTVSTWSAGGSESVCQAAAQIWEPQGARADPISG